MPALDLTKKAEKVGLVLAKRGVTSLPPIAVVAALDISGSMSDEYSRGDVQNAFDQCLGIALKIDDDGDIDVYAFDTDSYHAPVATSEDFGTYIGTRRGQGKFGHWPYGGTRYSPVLNAIVADKFPGAKPKGLFGFGGKKAPQGPPVMVLFFTDGDNTPGDTRATDAIIRQCSQDRTNIYFNLIALGNGSRDNFAELRRLADDYDNCGFTHLSNIRMSDDEIYDKLINEEFIAFVKGQGVPA